MMSKLAILSLVLGILSLFFFVLAAIPAIVIGILSILIIRSSAGEIRGKYVALAGMSISIVFMFIFCLLWRIDAPPIPNDYTIADLRSAPAECAESFEILKTLLGENDDSSVAPVIELTKSDSNMIAEIKGVIETAAIPEITKAISDNTEEINQIWADNERARNIIHRLNEFTEIADLTEPNDNSGIMRDRDLIKLARFYQVYTHLKIEQRDIRAFVPQLIEFDSVCRKLSVNARMFFPKLIYLVCIDENILTANTIVNDKRTPMSTVELLAGHFTPLTDEQTSLRNSILSSYLDLRSMLTEISEQIATEKTLPLKKNSTLRFYRNFYNGWIEAEEGRDNVAKTKLSVWPDIYPFKEPSLSLTDKEQIPMLYRCYNPHVNVAGPSYRVLKIVKSGKLLTQVQDDLLQIVLSNRLGKDFSLKARAYSDEYIIDIENRKVFSPGPDGKANTKDDIFLRINPDVLVWKD